MRQSMMPSHFRLLLFVAYFVATAFAWSSYPWQFGSLSSTKFKRKPTEMLASAKATYMPVLDFSNNPKTIEMIDRLDDAIMGGISTSSVLMQPAMNNVSSFSEQPAYAKWFGVCRTDGGGFCGFRTNEFREPLLVDPAADGIYILGRFASDNEPGRRVWKISTRVKPDRGEVVYQAPFHFPNKQEQEWSRIEIPFSNFKLVRGPRVVPGGPPINTTAGIFQLGMTMSKFSFGSVNMTEFKDFRPGFFEVHLREIGFYGSDLHVETPRVLSKEEGRKQRPLLLKVLLPIAKLFFSEQSQRRKSAMKILREKRGMSRWQAIVFGLKSRARRTGRLRSLRKTAEILAVDSFRCVVLTTLRVALVYPLTFVQRLLRALNRRENIEAKPRKSNN